MMVELYGVAIIRLFFFFIPALVFLAFDTGMPSVAIQIKEQGKYGLPGILKGKKLRNVIGVSTFNTILGVTLTVAIEMLFQKVLMWRSLLSLSKQLPFPWQALQSVIYGLFTRGALQYVIHRFVLHNPNSPIASLHKKWQHSVPAPFSLVAAYDHPIAYLLHHWVPLYVPAFLFRTHLLPFLVVLSVASMEELVTYYGYSVLPSAIMLKGMARRIDNHFIASGKGNFAAFGAVDWILGTSVGGDVVDDLKAEWDKHDVDKKISQGADDAGSIMESVGAKMKNASKRKGGRNGST